MLFICLAFSRFQSDASLLRFKAHDTIKSHKNEHRILLRIFTGNNVILVSHRSRLCTEVKHRVALFALKDSTRVNCHLQHFISRRVIRPCTRELDEHRTNPVRGNVSERRIINIHLTNQNVSLTEIAHLTLRTGHR